MKLPHHLLGVFIFAIFSTLAIPQANAASTLTATNVVATINQERVSRGLNTLRIDPALSQAAQDRSLVLAQHGRIFHVTAPKNTPWPEIAQAGYKYSFAGENLALGIETPHELVARWMASPTHRENILEEEFEDIGVGITVGTYEGMTVSYVVSYYAKKKTGAGVASLSQTAPVISSAPAKLVSRPVPTEAPVRKVGVSSPVLSDDYTLETLPPALPDISTSTDSEEDARVIDRLIAIFGSYLRTFQMRIGLL